MRSIHSGNDLLKVLEEAGAVQNGHFHLSSGYHSSTYVQCAKALQNPKIAEDIAFFLAQKAIIIPFMPFAVEYVVSPAMGGLIIGHEIARQLGCKFIFTERIDGEMKLRRGFELPSRARVIIVEDVVTTGKSTMEVIEVCKEAGANILGVVSIINRATNELSFGIPYIYGTNVVASTYNPVLQYCPMCEAREVLVKPGSRR